MLKLLKQALKIYFKAPFIFLSLQLPGTLPNLMERFMPKGYTEAPFYSLLPYLVPYFVIAAIGTFWSSAAMYIVTRQVMNGNVSIKAAIGSVNSKLHKLIPAALIAGVTILVGFNAFIIPGLILTAIYLFIPQLIIDEPPSQVMIYFNRSQKLSRVHLLKTVTIVLITAFLNLITYAGSQFIEPLVSEKLLSWFGIEVYGAIISGVLLTISLIAFDAFLDVLVSCYYLELRNETRE